MECNTKQGEFQITKDAENSRVSDFHNHGTVKLLGILKLHIESIRILRNTLRDARNSIDGISQNMSVEEIFDHLDSHVAYKIMLEDYLEYEALLDHRPVRNTRKPMRFISVEEENFNNQLYRRLDQALKLGVHETPILKSCPGNCSLVNPTALTKFYKSGSVRSALDQCGEYKELKEETSDGPTIFHSLWMQDRLIEIYDCTEDRFLKYCLK